MKTVECSRFRKKETMSISARLSLPQPPYAAIIPMAAVLFFTAISPALARVYYVAMNGDDSNPGTETQPFSTIQAAANIVAAGDTVIVKNGVYSVIDHGGTITSLLIAYKNGTPDAWITFRSENKWGAVLEGLGASEPSYEACLVINNSSYIRIEGFEMRKCAASTSVVAASNIIFYQNYFHDMARYRIPCENNLSEYGWGGSGCDKNSFRVSWDSNVFHNLGRLPGGCELYDYNHDHALYIQGSDISIINNLFWDNLAGWSIQLDGGGSVPGGIEGVRIINNTFYGKNPGRDGHIILWFDVRDVLIQNNVSHSPGEYFVDNDKQAGQYGCYGNTYLLNNLVYGGTVAKIESPSCDPGIDYVLSDNIVGQDPNFIDLEGRDFHLRDGSPAIDRGLSGNAPAYDIDGTIRPQGAGIDIGAYEFRNMESCVDSDEDGYGSPASGSCVHPEFDCDDRDADVHPGAAERCNGVDDDCDEQVDEAFPALGGACSAGVGACATQGTIVCSADGSGVECDAVPGLPSEEVCGNDTDEDCDGVLDNGCACSVGETRPCYSGPAGTEDVGVCHGGTQSCTDGFWGACSGQALPSPEQCADTLDNDCDGKADADDSDCTTDCAPGLTDCGGRCVNTQTSPVHCGYCNHACNAGDICRNGECHLDCGPGLVEENGRCVPIGGGGCGCGAGPGAGWAFLGLLALGILRRLPLSSVHWLAAKRALPFSLLAVSLALVAGCLAAGPGTKNEEEGAPIDGKLDSFQNPTAHGVIQFETPVFAEITDAERYHSWTFELAD